jgi:hypothetical protein
MKRLAHLALVGPLLALSACGEDANKVTTPNLPPLAFIRYVHAIPDTGAVIVRLTNPPVENVNGGVTVTYRTVTPWSGVAAGDRRVAVFPQTTNVNLAPMAITDTIVGLTAGKYYTLLHTGSGGRCDTKSARLVVIEEPMTTEPGGGLVSGNFALRTLIASPGFATQNIFVKADTVTVTTESPNATLGSTTTSGPASATLWQTRPVGPAVMHIHPSGVPATVANRTLRSTVTPGGAQFNTSISAPPGSTVAGTAMTAFIFGPALGATCTGTGGTTATYAVDVRPPVPQ